MKPAKKVLLVDDESQWITERWNRKRPGVSSVVRTITSATFLFHEVAEFTPDIVIFGQTEGKSELIIARDLRDSGYKGDIMFLASSGEVFVSMGRRRRTPEDNINDALETMLRRNGGACA